VKPTDSDPIASGSDLSRLWFSDPTGETAIRNILNAKNYSVVDDAGNVVFRIHRDELVAALPLYNFSPTRYRRSVRARLKEKPPAPAPTGNQLGDSLDTNRAEGNRNDHPYSTRNA
jgi:hypothetical protein